MAGEGAAAVRDAWPRHVGLKVEPGRRAICGKGGVSIAGGAGGGLREHRRVRGAVVLQVVLLHQITGIPFLERGGNF